EVRAGTLTAGSFDDNLYPRAYRDFLKQIAQSPYAGDVSARLSGRRLEILVVNGDKKPVGNVTVRVAGSDQTFVVLITRSDGRAIFLDDWDRVGKDGNLTVTVTPPGGKAPVKQDVRPDDVSCKIVLGDVAAPLPKALDLAIVLDTTASMGS